MIWSNPWALIGLAAVAIPVIIHLLGRHRSRVQKFPSLRFLAPSRLQPTRRKQLTDPLLLAIRVAIVGAAAVALAGPYIETDSRRADAEADLGSMVSRAVIVDTSASMSRVTVGGEAALIAARREAEKLEGEATIGTIIETANVARALPGAAAWLESRPGKRELIVVSDFQIGALDSVALTIVPAGTGVRLVRIGVESAPRDLRGPAGDRAIRASATATTTDVEWSAADRTAGAGPELLAGIDERSRADAASKAAIAIEGFASRDTGRRIAIIYKEYDRRADLLSAATLVDSPWMGDVIARLHSDPVLVGAVSATTVTGADSFPMSRFTAVVRNSAGVPVVMAAKGATDRLELWPLTDAGSAVSAALIAAAASATSPPAAPGEIEPEVWATDQLSRLERPAGTIGRPANDERSDARWLWLAALVLIGIESLLRRFKRTSVDTVMAVHRSDAARIGGRAA